MIPAKKERNSSIELLRIIAMFGVMTLHYNALVGFTFVEEGSINQYFMYASESLFICAVDLYIMISSYFLCITSKRKLSKVMELILQVIAFKIAFYMVAVIIGEKTFSVGDFLGCLLPANYFVILYCVLYILSPYINLLILGLDKKAFTKLLVILLVIFSVWTIVVDFLEVLVGAPAYGLSTVGSYGSQYGYSIVNFILIFFVGAYVRKNEISIHKKKILWLMLLVFVLIYCSALAEHKLGLSKISTWNYNNPLIILFSALVLLLFLRIKVKSRLINELSMGTFTCYLFHASFIPRLHIDEYVNKPLYILVLHQFISLTALYLVAYVVHKIYAFISRRFFTFMAPILDKVDLSLDG